MADFSKDSLGTRQKSYEEAYDSKIIRRIPVIIRADGKSFHRVTKRAPRPFCPILLDVMAHTMLGMVMEMEGAVFGYQQSDEITVILKNDQSIESEPWYGNRIQKMASISGSLATYSFNKYIAGLAEKPNLIGPALFDARVFAVPTVSEAINNLVWRQQDGIRNAITNAAQAELGKKFGRKTAAKLLEKRNIQERLSLLKTECGIEFESSYPTRFKHGIAVYKVPVIHTTANGDVARNKWLIDYEIPLFSKDRNFLLNILHSGHDVFRIGRDIKPAPSPSSQDELSEAERAAIASQGGNGFIKYGADSLKED